MDDTIKISLAAARVNAGFTQKEVAEIMHINKQTLVNWERGKIIPKQACVEMLARIYNFPVNHILLPLQSTES